MLTVQGKGCRDNENSLPVLAICLTWKPEMCNCAHLARQHRITWISQREAAGEGKEKAEDQ